MYMVLCMPVMLCVILSLASVLQPFEKSVSRLYGLPRISIREAQTHGHGSDAIAIIRQQARGNGWCATCRLAFQQPTTFTEARVMARAIGQEAWIDPILVACDFEVVCATTSAACVPVGDVPVIELWEAGAVVSSSDGGGERWGDQSAQSDDRNDKSIFANKRVVLRKLRGWMRLKLGSSG